jgi:hypothetical protein
MSGVSLPGSVHEITIILSAWIMLTALLYHFCAVKKPCRTNRKFQLAPQPVCQFPLNTFLDHRHVVQKNSCRCFKKILLLGRQKTAPNRFLAATCKLIILVEGSQTQVPNAVCPSNCFVFRHRVLSNSHSWPGSELGSETLGARLSATDSPSQQTMQLRLSYHRPLPM